MKNKNTTVTHKRWTTGQDYIFVAKDLEDAKDYARKVKLDPSKLREVKEDG
mgnify:CR=1 FL=1|tara:strand:- start:423 stop:575 length:153 start_codon:yes stop_codon:yes gene_type:complete